MLETVLLLDGDGTQTFPIAESLYKSGYKIHIFVNQKMSYGYYTRYANKKVLAPSVLSENEYVDFLVDYLKNIQVDAIIPMSDNTASLLSKYKSTLLNWSKFIIPDFPVFNNGYDKNALMLTCAKNNFPHPKSIDLADASEEKIDDSIFPALIKPNFSTGSRGITYVRNIDEFKTNYPLIRAQYGSCHLQEFIAPGGKQIKVQLFVDDECNLLYSSVIHKQRFYPVNGGSSCCNVTIKEDHLVGVCYQTLKKIGWIGFADFDMIEDPKDGIVKIMEINPRIPACIKSAVESGIDYGLIIVNATLGKKQKQYIYLPGKYLRHLGFDLLWFIKSTNRFKANPNWFRFFGRNIYYQDLKFSDPLPFIFGTISNIRKQLNPSFRKSKSGL